MNAEKIVKAASTCVECGAELDPEVRDAYRLLYGGGKLDWGRFAEEVAAVIGGFTRRLPTGTLLDGIISLALERCTDVTPEAFVAAVLHRKEEA